METCMQKKEEKRLWEESLEEKKSYIKKKKNCLPEDICCFDVKIGEDRLPFIEENERIRESLKKMEIKYI